MLYFYTDIHEFIKDCQPRTKLVKYDNGEMLADSLDTLIGWKNYLFQLLDIHGVNDVVQTEIHTTDLAVYGISSSDAEIATEKLKRYETPDNDKLAAELIQAGCKTLRSEIQ
jgi:hypothetical protein